MQFNFPRLPLSLSLSPSLCLGLSCARYIAPEADFTALNTSTTYRTHEHARLLLSVFPQLSRRAYIYILSLWLSITLLLVWIFNSRVIYQSFFFSIWCVHTNCIQLIDSLLALMLNFIFLIIGIATCDCVCRSDDCTCIHSTSDQRYSWKNTNNCDRSVICQRDFYSFDDPALEMCITANDVQTKKYALLNRIL